MSYIIDEERIKEKKSGGRGLDSSVIKISVIMFIIGLALGILAGDSVKAFIKELVNLPTAQKQTSVK